MRKALILFLTSLMLLVTGLVHAAPVQTNQAMVKGLSLSDSMDKVEKVMGKPYRIGNYYAESYWGGYQDDMYEYPGVNFVFVKGKMIKIILDSPQASLDNGVKVGTPMNTVVKVFGSDYSVNTKSEMVYDYVTDPITYGIGKLTFVIGQDTVKKILIEREKG